MKSNLETLITARAAIAEPHSWTIGSRRTYRAGVGYAYCALGAVDVATGERAEHHPITELLYSAMLPAERERGEAVLRNRWREEAPYEHSSVVAQFNNASTHSEVLTLFDRAIAAERSTHRDTDITIFRDMLKTGAPLVAVS